MRRQTLSICRLAPWLSCILVLTATTAVAQNDLTLADTVAVPGQTDVTVSISASTATSLTGLDADIDFSSSLCTSLEDQRVRIAGRTSDQVAEALLEAAACPAEGRTSLILMDLRGGAVVPAGSGPIGEWSFKLRNDAPTGSFPLALLVNQARNGPAVVNMSTAGARLILTRCTGDCLGDGSVTVDEIIRMVNIGLGTQMLGDCRPGDTSLDGAVTVDEIVLGVNNGLQGCPP